MYDIAAQVRKWLDDGRAVDLATVIATRGFSSRTPGAAIAWTGQESVGRLDAPLAPSAIRGSGLVDVEISEADALAAGLACGGTATLLVRPAAEYPRELWDRLENREPVCLVTPVGSGAPAALGTTTLLTPASIRDAYGYADPVPRLFGRGTTAVTVVEGDPRTVAVAYWPVPRLAVVGEGLIAEALEGAGALLGWSVQVVPDADAAVAVARDLHASDAFVVLSHDRDVDGPALAAALDGGAGYVGALGSRRTQAARRDWLTDFGVSEADQDRIHGPAGLDIDAHTPAEIAISIVAEIVAGRSSAGGGALRDRRGPVHVGGVHAPPPRYGVSG
ncbi:MAG: XdhC family protein [Jatrophihabitans sp.]|uniref:XdhC family protein n=1 Tax=Jatrophihabitans sp. TaxID=1932789 RepID=UPI003914C1A1